MAVSRHFENLRPNVSYFHVPIVLTGYFSQKPPIHLILKVRDSRIGAKSFNSEYFKRPLTSSSISVANGTLAATGLGGKKWNDQSLYKLV